MALYNYIGHVALRLSLHNVWFHLTRFILRFGGVPCSFSAHRAPGKKAPICKVLVRPGESRPFDLLAGKRMHLPLHHGMVRREAGTALGQERL